MSRGHPDQQMSPPGRRRRNCGVQCPFLQSRELKETGSETNAGAASGHVQLCVGVHSHTLFSKDIVLEY